MKKNKRVLAALTPLLTTLVIYITFYSSIESRPNHVGFWIILALGMSVGVFLTQVIQSVKEKDNN